MSIRSTTFLSFSTNWMVSPLGSRRQPDPIQDIGHSLQALGTSARHRHGHPCAGNRLRSQQASLGRLQSALWQAGRDARLQHRLIPDVTAAQEVRSRKTYLDVPHNRESIEVFQIRPGHSNQCWPFREFGEVWRGTQKHSERLGDGLSFQAALGQQDAGRDHVRLGRTAVEIQDRRPVRIGGPFEAQLGHPGRHRDEDAVGRRQADDRPQGLQVPRC